MFHAQHIPPCFLSLCDTRRTTDGTDNALMQHMLAHLSAVNCWLDRAFGTETKQCVYVFSKDILQIDIPTLNYQPSLKPPFVNHCHNCAHLYMETDTPVQCSTRQVPTLTECGCAQFYPFPKNMSREGANEHSSCKRQCDSTHALHTLIHTSPPGDARAVILCRGLPHRII